MPAGSRLPAAGVRVAIAGVAALAAAALWRPAPGFDLRGKVVLITGGSRGLGLVLARTLVARGARVALMARRPGELARAVESLGDPAHVLGVAGDVRVPESCTRVVGEVVQRFGRLDVLINNAGVILSAPLARTGIDDFQALMDVHFWGTIHMTSAALPHLLTHPGARVANICSIGGKVAVPHLSAYCASKFAQAGLSTILTGELRRHGVMVTTVYPGLMRTGSHLHAGFKGDTPREFRLFALAAGSPVTAISAERAARRILSAIERGQADLTFPGSMWLAARVSALMPNVTAEVMALVNRLLPDGRRDSPAAAAVRPIRGEELPLPPVVRAAIVLGERAAVRNNERVAAAP
jgi:NAD(P)-dependent dehydrogenase (short-subunit alcohol dehydrogenase family)